MNELLALFKLNKIEDIPYINGRIATEKDFEEGKAVFYLPQDSPVNTSKPTKLKIPFFAHLTKKGFFGTKKIPILVVQAEETVSGVTLGYLDKRYNKGIAMLNEVEPSP